MGRRPGLRFKALWRTLQANRGTARYHLHILEKTGVVRAVHDAGSTRFFPAGTDPARLSLMAVLLRGRVLEVAQAVRANPGIRQRDLTDKLPISRKVFRTYADLMVAAGLVEETHEPHQRRYFPTPQLDELLHALEAGPDAEPSEPQGPATGAEGFS